MSYPKGPHERREQQIEHVAVALRNIIAHWDEFGTEHGFGEIIDQARGTLDLYLRLTNEARYCGEFGKWPYNGLVQR